MFFSRNRDRRIALNSRKRFNLKKQLQFEPLESRQLLSVYHVDATDGLDTNPGTEAAPWQTVAKVNDTSLSAGDSVLFQRGEVWRENLVCDSGSSGVGNRITYSDYGDTSLAKPQFIGSIEKNNESDWEDLGSNIWSTKPALDMVDDGEIVGVGSELLPNESFDSDASSWYCYFGGSSSGSFGQTTTSGEYQSSPGGGKVSISNPGSNSYDIQLWTSNLSINKGSDYLLTFWAKADTAFELPSLSLMKNGSPYTSYGNSLYDTINITTGWNEYNVLFHASESASDARINFYLGDIGGANTLYIDTLSFKTCEETTPEILSNTSFDSDTSNWTSYYGYPAQGSFGRTTTSGEYQSSPGGGELAVTNPGTNSWDIQLWTYTFDVTAGDYYHLSFWAKVDSGSFTIPYISIMKNGSPYTSYASVVESKSDSLDITSEWQQFNVLYYASHTAADARLDFGLGGVAELEGHSFFIDTLSLTSATDSGVQKRLLSREVGNVIFNEGESCGRKYVSQESLTEQGDWYRDSSDWTVKVYSTSNPAGNYSDIEIAMTPSLVQGGSYNTIENLDLRNGGAHGLQFVVKSNITVDSCDISFMGGAGYGSSRYGNGVEFYGSTSNAEVIKCNIWDVWQAAVTNQDFTDTHVTQSNIHYRNNIIGRCGWGFEPRVNDIEDEMSGIYFENNTVYDSGGWGFDQPGEGGHGVYGSSLFLLAVHRDTIDDIYIRNNIFYQTNASFMECSSASGSDWSSLTIDYNLYYSSINGTWRVMPPQDAWERYYQEDFEDYQTETGFDEHSILLPMSPSPEMFVDSENADFHLVPTSQAVNAGTDVGYAYDIDGNTRPQGSAYDIGAYEYRFMVNVDFNTSTPSPNFTGEGVLLGGTNSGGTWNSFPVSAGSSASVDNLIDSSGVASTVDVILSATHLTSWDSPNGNNGPANDLLRDYAYIHSGAATSLNVTISGLESDAYYELVVYAAGDQTTQGADISGAIEDTTSADTREEYSEGDNYVSDIVQANGSGVLTFTIEQTDSIYTCLNGLQIAQVDMGAMMMMGGPSLESVEVIDRIATLDSKTATVVNPTDDSFAAASLDLTSIDDQAILAAAIDSTVRDRTTTVRLDRGFFNGNSLGNRANNDYFRHYDAAESDREVDGIDFVRFQTKTDKNVEQLDFLSYFDTDEDADTVDDDLDFTAFSDPIEIALTV